MNLEYYRTKIVIIFRIENEQKRGMFLKEIKRDFFPNPFHKIRLFKSATCECECNKTLFCCLPRNFSSINYKIYFVLQMSACVFLVFVFYGCVIAI